MFPTIVYMIFTAFIGYLPLIIPISTGLDHQSWQLVARAAEDSAIMAIGGLGS